MIHRLKSQYTFIELCLIGLFLCLLVVFVFPKYLHLTKEKKENELHINLAQIRTVISKEYMKTIDDKLPRYPTLNATLFPQNRIPKEPFSGSSMIYYVKTFKADRRGGWLYNVTLGEIHPNKRKYIDL